MDKFDDICETFVLSRPRPDRMHSVLDSAHFSLRYAYRNRLCRDALGYYETLPDAEAAAGRYALLFPKYRFLVLPVLF